MAFGHYLFPSYQWLLKLAHIVKVIIVEAMNILGELLTMNHNYILSKEALGILYITKHSSYAGYERNTMMCFIFQTFLR